MKSNKDIVLEVLRQCTGLAPGEDNQGVATQYLSKRLDMQRTNISTILNSLVKEGVVEKSSGRPVLYRITQSQIKKGEDSCFADVTGCEGSLKRSVQLAKAAVLYPRHGLHCLLTGPGGTGKSYFVSMIHQFAVDHYVLDPDAPLVKFNCSHFADRTERITRTIFDGADGKASCLEQAENGLLFIDHGELLPPEARSRLFHLVENNFHLRDGKRCNLRTIVLCSIEDTMEQGLAEIFESRFPVTICLPPLEERPLNERFALIRQFLTREATRSSQSLSVTAEILIALLLYHCPHHVKQLKNDICIACANAYVRGLETERKEIRLAMSDFPRGVRNGLLGYKKRSRELRSLISENASYVFSADQDMQTEPARECRPKNDSIYQWIEERTEELEDRGISRKDIHAIIGIDIENEFNKYNTRLASTVVDKGQLAELVPPRIIELVTEYLDRASSSFKRIFPVSVFYGLCLHLNAVLYEREKSQKLSSDRLIKIIEEHKEEYAMAVNFSTLLEKEFSVRLSIDEVVFLAMYLCGQSGAGKDAVHPVLLIAMHGERVASSLAKVIGTLSGNQVGAYDMPLTKSTQDTYPELKQAVTDLDQGAGILALYDMGSLRQMFEMISAETGIPIRAIAFPLTALALDCSRRVMMEPDLDTAYAGLLERYHTLPLLRDDVYGHTKSGDVILALCMSGQGTAVRIKKYLEKRVHWDEVKIICLSISDRDQLMEEINRIYEKQNILCTVGAVDPQLLEIPFVPVTKVFECPPEKLKSLLRAEAFQPENEEEDEDDRIIMELAEGLQYFGPDQVKKWISPLVSDMERCTGETLGREKWVGLSVHLACCLNRLIGGEETPENLHRDELLRDNQKLYEKLQGCMKPVESAFHIQVDENEYAHILYILKGRKSEAKRRSTEN